MNLEDKAAAMHRGLLAYGWQRKVAPAVMRAIPKARVGVPVREVVEDGPYRVTVVVSEEEVSATEERIGLLADHEGGYAPRPAVRTGRRRAPAGKAVKVQALMSSSDLERVRRAAKRRGMSLSALVTGWVRAALALEEA